MKWTKVVIQKMSKDILEDLREMRRGENEKIPLDHFRLRQLALWALRQLKYRS